MDKKERSELVDVTYKHAYKGTVYDMHPYKNIRNDKGEGLGQYSIRNAKDTSAKIYVAHEELAELFSINAFSELGINLRMKPLIKYGDKGEPPALKPSNKAVKSGSSFSTLMAQKKIQIKAQGFSEELYSKLKEISIAVPSSYFPRKFTAPDLAINSYEGGATIKSITPTDSEKTRRKLSLEELEAQLARQREIGGIGEAVAFRHECDRLRSCGCDNPTAHVEELSKADVGAGYDLRSKFNGEKRFIEVKSSVNTNESFFLSENERITLTELGEEAYIYLVQVDQSDRNNSKVIEEIPNPMADTRLALEPVAYKVTINKA